VSGDLLPGSVEHGLVDAFRVIEADPDLRGARPPFPR
jgi:hypothetical protein